MAHAGQPEIRLVHERGGLQRVVAPFLPQVVGRELPELAIHERHEGIERLRVPGPPLVEQCRHRLADRRAGRRCSAVSQLVLVFRQIVGEDIGGGDHDWSF